MLRKAFCSMKILRKRLGLIYGAADEKLSWSEVMVASNRWRFQLTEAEEACTGRIFWLFTVSLGQQENQAGQNH